MQIRCDDCDRRLPDSMTECLAQGHYVGPFNSGPSMPDTICRDCMKKYKGPEVDVEKTLKNIKNIKL